MTTYWMKFAEEHPEEYDLLFDIIRDWRVMAREKRKQSKSVEAFGKEVDRLAERMGALRKEDVKSVIIVAGWYGTESDLQWFDSLEEVQRAFPEVFKEGMTLEEMRQQVEEVNAEGNYNAFWFLVRDENEGVQE